jgi:hypothetical protein
MTLPQYKLVASETPTDVISEDHLAESSGQMISRLLLVRWSNERLNHVSKLAAWDRTPTAKCEF